MPKWHNGTKSPARASFLHGVIFMFMLYLDASGTPELQDQSKHYALVGAAVHENTWFALNNRIRGLKNKYAYPGEDFELHAKDFCLSINEQNRVSQASIR